MLIARGINYDEKDFYSAFILFILSACSQKEKENVDTTKDEMPPMQNVEIPSNIFTSEKQNRIIDEEEIKSSIKHTWIAMKSYLMLVNHFKRL